MGFLDLFKKKDRPEKSKVPLLLQALETGDAAAREDAVRQLGALGLEARDAVEALSRALEDEGKSVRLQAADALVKVGGDAHKAMEVLAALLEDGDASIRRAAAVQVGRSADRAAPAAPALVKALGDGEDRVVEAAVDALVQVGAVAVPALVEVLQSEKGGDRTRQGAVTAASHIAPRAIPTFLEMTEDASPRVRYIGALGLADLTPAGENLQPILEALAGEDWLFRAWAARVLGLFGREVEEEAAGLLESALKDDHPEVRAAAVEALGKVRPAE